MGSKPSAGENENFDRREKRLRWEQVTTSFLSETDGGCGWYKRVKGPVLPRNYPQVGRPVVGGGWPGKIWMSSCI